MGLKELKRVGSYIGNALKGSSPPTQVPAVRKGLMNYINKLARKKLSDTSLSVKSVVSMSEFIWCRSRSPKTFVITKS